MCSLPSRIRQTVDLTALFLLGPRLSGCLPPTEIRAFPLHAPAQRTHWYPQTYPGSRCPFRIRTSSGSRKDIPREVSRTQAERQNSWDDLITRSGAKKRHEQRLRRGEAKSSPSKKGCETWKVGQGDNWNDWARVREKERQESNRLFRW